MRVTCVFLQEFYEAVGRFEVELEVEEGATIRDLIERIDREVLRGFRSMVLEDDKVKWPVMIMVNGRRIEFLGGLDTRLRDGDRVVFSPRALFVV